MVIGENNVGILVDKSGSMHGLQNKVVETVNSWVDKIKEECYRGGIKTTVSFGVFNHKFDLVLDRVPIDKLRKIQRSDINPNGQTALCESASKMMDVIGGGVHREDETYLLIVVTDGAENASAISYRNSLPDKIKESILKDNWTIVFLVPPGDKHEIMRWGIYDDNVQEWEANEKGMERAKGETLSGLNNYYRGIASGSSKATKSFFQKVTTDMDNVKTSTVKAKLTDVTDDFKLLEVSDDVIIISDFVASKKINYILGNAYYQLVKPEKVQPGKEVLVRDKTKKVVYGGHYARQLIGMDDINQAYKLTPGNHGNYEIFIQSKSVNRKLFKGHKVLVKK